MPLCVLAEQAPKLLNLDLSSVSNEAAIDCACALTAMRNIERLLGAAAGDSVRALLDVLPALPKLRWLGLGGFDIHAVEVRSQSLETLDMRELGKMAALTEVPATADDHQRLVFGPFLWSRTLHSRHPRTVRLHLACSWYRSRPDWDVIFSIQMATASHLCR